MRNTIATYKESLSRIAGDVLDAAADLEGPRPASPFTERRSSYGLAQLGGPPAPNGHAIEIEQHKAEVERLQASEAEIKALAINYAALLKEKESQLSRLHEENSSLRKSLEVKNGTSPQARDENLKSARSTSFSYKVTSKQSPTKQQKNTSQVSPRSSGNSSQKNTLSRQDTLSNGGVRSAFGSPTTQSQKEIEALLEEKNKALAEIRDHHESEINQLTMELKNERQISADFKSKFSDEQRRSSSSQKDIHDLKLENERTFIELKDLQKRLDSKISEIGRLQAEMGRRNSEKDSDNILESLKTSIAMLQDENSKLKLEKERLAASLQLAMRNDSVKNADNSESLHNMEHNFNKEKEEMLVSFQQLEKDLKDTHTERDKAQRELARLKQHLLDKELEESEKMDEDSKVIEELRAISEHQKTQILKLEKALRQEVAMHEKTKTIKSDDIQRLTETVDDLNEQLANYMNIVETKNVELLNLQTALGQYYAESEAKERLERDLAASREEFIRIFDSLKVAKQENHYLVKEKEDMSIRLSQAERMLQESKHTIQKLQEDNSKLHRAVEQSMTRINRMSMDSDFYVDRRIVIKLLVTYFQRNHSKEVLDLMVRMLGFSDEDKQRIGFAQQTAGKGRGVLGLPGRLVGGILGGKTPASSEVPSENQSFTDLWVDFLLKETEQRGRLEAESAALPSSTQEKSSDAAFGSLGTTTPSQSRPLTQYPSANRVASPFPRQNQPFEPDSEFATVSLSSSAFPSTESGSRLSRLLQR